MRRFETSTMLITGASSGMGLAAAQRFLDEGARDRQRLKGNPPPGAAADHQL